MSTNEIHNCKLCNCQLSTTCVMLSIGPDEQNNNNQMEYYCKSCYAKGVKK